MKKSKHNLMLLTPLLIMMLGTASVKAQMRIGGNTIPGLNVICKL